MTPAKPRVFYHHQLKKRRKSRKRRRTPRPELTIQQILGWADEYYARTGRWPGQASGRIAGTPGETWNAIEKALARGGRGLPYKDSSIAKLLAQERGVRNRRSLPPLTMRQIVCWIDAYHQRTGTWPTCDSGSIAEAPGETWKAIERALVSGKRGLLGGSSLSRLLTKVYSVSRHWRRPDLSETQILAWADDHHARTGRWPNSHSQAVHAAATDETWMMIDYALRFGIRGMPGGSSLAQFLREHRGRARRRTTVTVAQI